MELVTKQVVVSKELTEVFDCLASVLHAVKTKQDIQSIIASNIGALLKAVDGFQVLPEEIKSENFENTAALGLASLVKALRA